jgi:GTP-binding protein HflX
MEKASELLRNVLSQFTKDTDKIKAESEFMEKNIESSKASENRPPEADYFNENSLIGSVYMPRDI